MMKKLILLPALLLAFGSAFAQKVESKNVQIGSITPQGFTVTIEKNVDLVKDAMEQRLDDAKLKTKKNEGFVVAFGQRFSEIDPEPINFYTKVEKAGKNKTQVTVCAIPTDLSADQKELQNNLHNFLSNFVQYVNKFEARNNMEVEQGNLKKAQKKHASAVSVVEKLDKSIKNDQEKIADKKKDIEKYKQKIIECQEDIKKLEANIAKNQEKKKDAQKDVEDANDNVRNVQGEVEKYRTLSE